MVFCHSCGKENKKGKFCKFCGQKLKVSKFHNKLLFFIIPIFILIVLEVIALNSPIEKNNFFGSIKRGNFLMLGIEFCGNSNCIADELYVCKKDCVWCGDGTCQKDEIGSCYDDCEWCGDGYCQKNEDCSSCAKDCGNCKAQSYCGDLVCNPGECEIGCYKDCLYTQCENGVCEKNKGENCLVTPNDCRCKLDEYCNKITATCDKVTCGNLICESNENSKTCPADCKEVYTPEKIDPNTNLPIVFIHGHSPQEKDNVDYSINAFSEFQNKLEADGIYTNKGILLPSAKKEAIEAGLWGKLSKPVSVRTTYYLGVYDDRGSIIGAEDEQSISTYADRISKTIETLKSYTGKNKVILIAHSMGGLVAREYISKYGSQNVDTLITIGTPNHGIYGYIAELCEDGFLVFPGHVGSECGEMTAGSPFLTKLNSDETPGNTKYITIAGDCCFDDSNKPWDETIRVESVALNGATNIIVKGQEVSGLDTFHSALTHSSKVPEVYNKVVELLK